MKVEPAPPARARQSRKYQSHEEQSIFDAIEKVVIEVVGRNVEEDILVGKDNERIKKNPPAQQHQEIEYAEKNLAFAVNEVGAPGHGREHRHGMKKKEDIKEKGIGNVSVEN